MAQQILRPTDEREIAAILADLSRNGRKADIQGGASKQAMGRPVEADVLLSTRNLRGTVLYEPTELVMSVRAGTSLSTLESELAKHHQQLAFEPIDMGPMLGQPAGQSTIGGVVATNLSGSRRIQSGAVRDHVLGLKAVNGQGEIIKAGGRVMKNVTGYDLCRGLAGSWGTLGLFTEVTLRAQPAADESRTLLLFGQPDEIAVEVMCAAIGSQFEVSGAIHLQEALTRRLRSPAARSVGTDVTALRIESFGLAVARRAAALRDLFSAYGELIELEHEQSVDFWEELRALSFLTGSTEPVWRISTSPRMGPRVVQAIAGYMDVNAAFDWSGGLVWLEVPHAADAGAADIRRVIATRGGHATLVRADPEVRAAVEVFQPLEAGLMRLTGRLKEAFDPQGVLNPGRMYASM